MLSGIISVVIRVNKIISTKFKIIYDKVKSGYSFGLQAFYEVYRVRSRFDVHVIVVVARLSPILFMWRNNCGTVVFPPC